jgi:xanthine dehydrogenase accessory factor
MTTSRAGSNPDLDALEAAARWQAEGLAVALSIVMKTWGSSPRPVGSLMAANEMGQFAGSVSGGCVESVVLLDAKKAMAGLKAVRQSFGVSDEEAQAANLACGGQMEVLTIAPPSVAPLLKARLARQPIALAVRLSDGAASILAGETAIPRTTGLDETSEHFVLSFLPRPRILIVGASHIAQALAQMAPLAGFDVAVIEPRHAFSDPARVAGQIHSKEMPSAALARLGLDPLTALVTLTHQNAIDDEALRLGLASPCFYLGALGSRKTHAARLERLGPTAQRIKGPVGLDIGAVTAPEIAVSILAEIIHAWRRGNGKS